MKFYNDTVRVGCMGIAIVIGAESGIGEHNWSSVFLCWVYDKCFNPLPLLYWLNSRVDYNHLGEWQHWIQNHVEDNGKPLNYIFQEIEAAHKQWKTLYVESHARLHFAVKLKIKCSDA